MLYNAGTGYLRGKRRFSVRTPILVIVFLQFKFRSLSMSSKGLFFFEFLISLYMKKMGKNMGIRNPKAFFSDEIQPAKPKMTIPARKPIKVALKILDFFSFSFSTKSSSSVMASSCSFFMLVFCCEV